MRQGAINLSEQEKNCQTKQWRLQTSKRKSGRSFPPIWPGVYVWLLVGVIFIISRFF